MLLCDLPHRIDTVILFAVLALPSAMMYYLGPDTVGFLAGTYGVTYEFVAYLGSSADLLHFSTYALERFQTMSSADSMTRV